MKRSTYALIAVLLVCTSFGTAEAKSSKHRKKKAVAPVEMTVGAEEDRDKPIRGPQIKPERKQSDGDVTVVPKPGPIPFGHPIELQLKRAASRRFDLRSLPQTRPIELERAELPEPAHTPVAIEADRTIVPEPSAPVPPTPSAPAPPPTGVFEGLDRFTWGAGSPPDTNGDAGPNNYIQTVNTSIGVFRKSDGFQQAAFTFNTFMSQGAFGNLCDTNNFGDPVVLYDTFEDRWVITDFAFLTDISGNVLAPAFQCFAVSMNGDPVSGGWNFYSIQISDALNDYPKFAVWTDGIYMSSNLFSFGAGSAFRGVRLWAFNKAQMYAGSPTVKIVAFDVAGGDFTLIPSNARLQTGTPPPGRPNLFVSTWLFTNALTVYKFQADWNSLSLSTLTGPDTPIAATSWPNAAVANAPQPGTATLLDVLQIRAMVQNQYTNFGGTESLWLPHTVRRANTAGFAAPRWYQVNVTGGTVAGAIPQATTWDPDGANTNHRFMPSLALDRAGNMAMGYSISNATTMFPSLAYAGRLAADAANTFSQTEQTFFTGTASQTGTTRWGDYSSMTLDPDGCTFWYTSEYANPADQTFNHRWLTKFGRFGPFTGCTPVGAGGTVSGTVTVNPGGAPIAGATVNLGMRSTTTDGSGNYSFLNIPAGTYPSMTASKPGFVTGSASSIVVTDGGTTTQNFSLTAAPASACLTDTTQADFLTGVFTNVDLNTSPGDVILSNAPFVDQQNTAGTTTGTGFGTPNWTGQTFIAGVTGQLVKADVQLFCNGCGATPPNLTLSVRNTTAGLPTGADLTTATIPGSTFASGASITFTATFGSPIALTSGTQYALILRPVSVPAGSGYFWIRSSPSTYASGSRVLSADSGGTWSADATRDYNFKTYMQTGFAPSGNLVSSPKDSNPAGGLTPIWSTFSWNGTTPTNTSLKFQLAASNNGNGPFTFVGPDGTAGTFFTTSPVQLSPQFYNFRFMEYKALLATTDGTVTPTLNDATFCFNDVDCSGTTPTITPTPAQVCANSTGNTASGPAGMTAYAWGIANGTITSATNTQSITYTAGASGSVTLTLTVTTPSGCITPNSALVSINPIPATPAPTNTGPYCEGQTIQLNTAAVTGAIYAWTGPAGFTSAQQNPTLSNATPANAGTYSVTVTVSGCASAAGTTSVVVNAQPATPSATNGGPYCEGQTIQLNTPTVAGVTYSWTGPNGFTSSAQNPARTNATLADGGTYSVTITDTNGCTSLPGTTNVVVNPIPATPTPTNGGPYCTGQTIQLTTATVTGATYAWTGPNAFASSLQNPTIASATLANAGTYSLTVTVSGCTSAAGTTDVVVNQTPATPTATNGGPYCAGQTIQLNTPTVASATYSWTGPSSFTSTAQNPTIPSSTTANGGTYSVTVTVSGCTSAAGNTTVVVNPVPATPTATNGGPYCAGATIQLNTPTVATATYAWSGPNAFTSTQQNPTIPSSTVANGGTYSVTVTVSGCTSAAGNTTVVVNPIPATPTATNGGPYCAGATIQLNTPTVATATYAWTGPNAFTSTQQNPSIPSSTVANGGTYSVTVTVNGCTSAAGNTTVVVNPNPNATITVASPMTTGTSANATVANAGGGATYAWSVTGGSINSGQNTPTLNFTAGATGTLTINVTVTTAAGCSDSKSANVTVIGAVTITSIVPNGGPVNGGTAVTVNGTGFQVGVQLRIGGNVPTNVVRVSSTKITARTPAHAAGAVNVTVTNPDTSTATLTNGYTYRAQRFDPNGDGMIDPSDIFYLVNYLFLHGPAPRGTAGLLSGDANGDNLVDPSDIFYTVSYLFLSGPTPFAEPAPGGVSASAASGVRGSVTLGQAVLRDGKYFVPVEVAAAPGSAAPQAISLRVRYRAGAVGAVDIHRTGGVPVFEISRHEDGAASYLLMLDPRSGALTGTVAEIELTARGDGAIDLQVDPDLTMLTDQSGAHQASVANGALRVTGTTIERERREPNSPRREQ